MSSTVGLLCAIGSVVFNGSFTSLFKTKKMVELSIHPMVFQLYVCLGIFVSSWCVVPFLRYNSFVLHDDSVGTTFVFSPMGLLAGMIFVLAVSASFSAVEDIGVALAQGVWGGGAIVIAYLWGVVVFGEVPSRIGLSLVGLALLVIGVVGIAFCETIANKLSPLCSGYNVIPLSSLDGGEDVEASSLNHERGISSDGRSRRNYFRGLLWAAGVGFFGGSVLVPLHYAPDSQQGFVFLPSFGLGAMLLSPMVFYAYILAANEIPRLHMDKALLPGMVSGLIWNMGNLLSLIAISAVTYGVAYPIMQCAILVSGMWGIYIFKEISQQSTIAIFWLGGLVLLTGAACLAAA